MINMTRPSFWLIPLAALCALPAQSAVLTNSKTPVNNGVILAVPALRMGGLGAGLTRGAAIAAPVLALSLPGVAVPSVITFAAPSVDLSLPVAALAPAVPAGEASILPTLSPAAEGTGLAGASKKITRLSESVQPDLKAVAEPSLQGEGSQAAGERVMSAVLGRTGHALPDLELSPAQDGSAAAAPSGQAKQAILRPNKGRKTSPLLKQVSYSSEIPAESRALFQETQSRRKAAWIRQLGGVGVKLLGPVEPVLEVKASRDISKGEKVEFIVDWTQGETHAGSFKAVVSRKNLDPDLRRLPAPPVPDEKKVVLRFKKTVLVKSDGLAVEASVTAEDITGFLEEHRLRLISEDRYNGVVIAAVTGSDEAESMARAIRGRGILLSATPLKLDAPEERQLLLAFKKTTVVDIGIRVESGVSDTDKAAMLADHGLSVLEVTRNGVFRVAVEQGVSAAAAARGLSVLGPVRHAYAVLAHAPEDRQVVLKFRETAVLDAGGLKVEARVSDDDVASLLTSRGIEVLEALGERIYRVAAPAGTTGASLAAALAGEAAVESATAVGNIPDADIEASARGVASYKGRPWSSTEYNMVYGTTEWSLVERGAAKAQVEKFRRLCDEAPVRGGGFNPWSGD